jgi:hypothetical protein
MVPEFSRGVEPHARRSSWFRHVFNMFFAWSDTSRSFRLLSKSILHIHPTPLQDSSPSLQWNLALTPPYLTPSTFNSNTSPALSHRISSVKSRLSNSTPFVVVNRVNKLLGTVFKSVVSVQTLISPFLKESGAASESQAIRSSSTIRD